MISVPCKLLFLLVGFSIFAGVASLTCYGCAKALTKLLEEPAGCSCTSKPDKKCDKKLDIKFDDTNTNEEDNQRAKYDVCLFGRGYANTIGSIPLSDEVAIRTFGNVELDTDPTGKDRVCKTNYKVKDFQIHWVCACTTDFCNEYELTASKDLPDFNATTTQASTPSQNGTSAPSASQRHFAPFTIYPVMLLLSCLSAFHLNVFEQNCSP